MDLVEISQVIIGIVSTACWLLVLIQLFKWEGIIKGILGILFSIYVFIWGWMHEYEHYDFKAVRIQLTTVMRVWSICIALSIILWITG